MSRIDPGLLTPALPRINPAPSPLERAQRDATLADQQAQIQERQAQADALRQANAKARATYNASQAIRGWLSNNPDAFKNDPEGAMGKLLAIGGPEGIPIVKDILDQGKNAIEQAKSKIGFQQSITKELADAFSLEPDVSKHPDLERGILQKYVQGGSLTEAQANAMLQQPPDALAELQGHQQALDRINKQLDESAARNEKAANAFKALAEGNKATAEITAPIVVPEGGTLANRQTGAPLLQSPPKATDFDKQFQSWKGSADSKGYDQTEAGYKKYLEDYNRTTQINAAIATEKAKAGNDPRLANVAPNLHKDVLDKVQKAEDDNTTAQQAADDMKTFIDQIRAGNKQAAAYIDTEGVLTLNTGRGVKRVNSAEISSYGNAGSIYDRVVGALKKGGEGIGKSDSIINDIERLHQQVTANAQTAHDRKIQSINKTYGSSFQSGGTAAAGDMIDVQIPGQPPGKIHASQWDAFKKKYPNATRK